MDGKPERPAEETTEILSRWTGGDTEALERLMPRVYDELRRMARAYAGESNTLQPTVLVHELYMKLIAAGSLEVKDRGHFLAVAAKAMRRIAIDGARAALTQKRGGDLRLEPMDGNVAGAAPDETIVRVNDALEALERTDPRKAAVVEMRFFGGLEMSEVASALHVSLATAERDWKFARAWLYNALGSRS